MSNESKDSIVPNTLDQAAVGIAHVGLEGRFIDVNSCLCDLVGYSRPELLQKTFQEITFPADLDTDLEQLDQLLNDRIPNYTMEKRYFAKDGSLIWVRLTVSLHRNVQNEPRYFIYIIQDVGEMREEQKTQLFENESSSAAASSLHSLESLGVAAANIDAHGVIRSATPQFATLAGCPLHELLNADLQTVMFGLFIELNEEQEEELVETVTELAQEVQFDKPVRIILKNEEVRWVIPHASNVQLKDGRSVGRLLALRDVTSLMEARIASEENERKYRDLVEMANSIILRVGPDHTIQFVNEYALRYFVDSEKALVGSNMLDALVPPFDTAGSDQHEYARVVAREPELHGSFDQLCRRGQESAWVHWSVRALRDERGRVESLLYVGTDVTQRKRAETEAKHYRLRSRSLAEQLINTEEQERAGIANYLHDNIIQLISLSNIRMGGVLSDMVEAGHSIEVAERIAGIRTLLGDAATECRMIMDQLVPALLNELGLVAALRHLAEKHERMDGTVIRVHDRLDGALLEHNLAALLFRGIRELLMNALKYAGACSIEIDLWIKKGRLYTRVRDDGAGFDVQILDDSSYDEKGGFGLFALEERLENIGGKVEISSQKGTGTMACISVPYSS
ncbi:PAS domain S-box protein [Pontiellaceae bacterium B1224]|nr:PAS domain S-box protein [Pontiellaceae bacterium B1224]